VNRLACHAHGIRYLLVRVSAFPQLLKHMPSLDAILRRPKFPGKPLVYLVYDWCPNAVIRSERL